MYVTVNECLWLHLCVCVHLCVSVYVHLSVCVYVFIYVCAFVCASVCIYLCVLPAPTGRTGTAGLCSPTLLCVTPRSDCVPRRRRRGEKIEEKR